MNYEGLDIRVLQFSTGQTETLLHGGYWPRYLPTSGDTGHLVYMHEGHCLPWVSTRNAWRSAVRLCHCWMTSAPIQT